MIKSIIKPLIDKLLISEDEVIERAQYLVNLHGPEIKKQLNLTNDVEIVVKKEHVKDMFNFDKRAQRVCGTYGQEDKMIYFSGLPEEKKVFIYAVSIRTMWLGSRKHFNYKVVSTLAHELMHVKQEEVDANYMDDYIAFDGTNYKQYANQPIEAEAEQYALKYVASVSKSVWKK